MPVELSDAARSALHAAGSNRQGARVVADKTVLGELYNLGLIGAADGLTRSGTIARERVVNQAMAAFDL